jgi:hypothetical protein
MRKSVVWIPILLVGAMVYWTLALGFGGLSLMSVTSDSFASPDGIAKDGYQSITVNLGDPSGAGPQTPGAVTVDLVTEHELPQAGDSDRGAGGQDDRGSGRRRVSDDRGPGETAF